MKDLTDEQLDAIAGSSDYFDGYMAIRAASAADRALNAPADRTYEQEHAIKEGHRNKIEDDYFDARPGFSQVHRVSFRGGFDRGWDAAKKDAPAGRDVMRQAVTEEMAAAYLTASNRYWRETDKWRNGTALEASRVSLEAALAAAPTPPATNPSPDVLAILRSEVQELPSYRGVLWAIRRNDVLALIDKMGGTV